MAPVQETSHRYIQARKIGEGTFGSVSIVWDTELQCARAMKTYKPESDGDVSECALREIAFQSFLTDSRAPGVVPFLAVVLGEGSEVSMLMPLMEQDLAEAIDRKAFETWECARPVLLDVISAVSFLHSCTPALMHRDLKPENVLLDPTGTAYLTDFGFMRFCKDGPPFDSGPFSCGSNQRSTKTYCAPEMLRHGVAHGPGVDMWAVGVIAAELVQNARLTASTDKTARKQLRALCARVQPEPQRSLLGGLLAEDVAARWSAATALERAFALPTLAALAPAAVVVKPEPPAVVRPEVDFGDDVKTAVAARMLELDFRCPQTFYAACCYATDASAWRSTPAPALDKVCLLAALTASKIYEHEFWLLSDVEKQLGEELLADAVAFKKALLHERAGRLLIPFAETLRALDEHAPWLTAKRRRKF